MNVIQVWFVVITGCICLSAIVSHYVRKRPTVTIEIGQLSTVTLVDYALADVEDMIMQIAVSPAISAMVNNIGREEDDE